MPRAGTPGIPHKGAKETQEVPGEEAKPAAAQSARGAAERSALGASGVRGREQLGFRQAAGTPVFSESFELPPFSWRSAARRQRACFSRERRGDLPRHRPPPPWHGTLQRWRAGLPLQRSLLPARPLAGQEPGVCVPATAPRPLQALSCPAARLPGSPARGPWSRRAAPRKRSSSPRGPS